MAKKILSPLYYCIVLSFSCSPSIASLPVEPLKCHTPRKKYNLVFKKGFVTILDNLTKKKVKRSFSGPLKEFPLIIKTSSYKTKNHFNFYSYKLYLKKINTNDSSWKGHLTVSTFLKDKTVNFFFPLSCLNNNYLKSMIFISQK